MTNLKLPEMSFKNLSKLAPSNGNWKKIAYATYVRNVLIGQGIVEVKHHNSVIANIFELGVDLDNHGYNSRSTAHRMNQILRDNGVHDKSISMRKDLIVVLDREGEKAGDIPAYFPSI